MLENRNTLQTKFVAPSSTITVMHLVKVTKQPKVLSLCLQVRASAFQYGSQFSRPSPRHEPQRVSALTLKFLALALKPLDNR